MSNAYSILSVIKEQNIMIMNMKKMGSNNEKPAAISLRLHSSNNCCFFSSRGFYFRSGLKYQPRAHIYS